MPNKPLNTLLWELDSPTFFDSLSGADFQQLISIKKHYSFDSLDDARALNSGKKIYNDYSYHGKGAEFQAKVLDDCFFRFCQMAEGFMVSSAEAVTMEYREYFNQIFDHFSYVIDKYEIQLIIFNRMPCIGADLILYGIAKAQNIRTLIFDESPFSGRYFVCDEMEAYGSFDYIKPNTKTSDFKLKRSVLSLSLSSMRSLSSYGCYDLFRDLIQNFQSKGFRLYAYFQKLDKEKDYRKRLERIIAKPGEIDLSKKYIYFSMAKQPSTDPGYLAGRYQDQLIALERLYEKLPANWMIYVHESPEQTHHHRGQWFFERLELLRDRVVYLPHDYDRGDLVKHASATASVGSPDGWLFLRNKKPHILFGQAWYQSLGGVYSFNDSFDVQDLKTFSYSSANLDASLEELSARSHSLSKDLLNKALSRD